MVDENEKDRRTPVFDWDLGDFKRDFKGRIVTATESTAAEQIILKALETVRGRDLIYGNVDDPDQDYKYGNDADNVLRQKDLSEDVRISELKRAVTEALIYIDWVTDVTNIDVIRIGTDEAEIDFTVSTIFDDNMTVKGVTING